MTTTTTTNTTKPVPAPLQILKNLCSGPDANPPIVEISPAAAFVAELDKHTGGHYYGYERRASILAVAPKQAGYSVDTVAVGGYRLEIAHVGDLLIAIQPKAASARKATSGITIDAPTGYNVFRAYPASHQLAAAHYSQDYGGGQRLRAALNTVLLAFLESGGQREALYQALGRSGFCAICGATLTDDLSMARGIGPDCYTKIYGGLRAVQTVVRRRVSKEAPKTTRDAYAAYTTKPAPEALAASAGGQLAAF